LFTLLPKPIRGVLVSILVISSTVFWCIPLYFFAFLRFVGQATAEPWCTRRAMNMAELWIDFNNLFMGWFVKLDIEVRGGEDLSPTNWYLVFSNHQSWADIIILQRVLNRKIPMLKFFIKQQLI
jgi:1-acyl-sn-glycerol-3-phosphate acyltransferase